MRSRTDVAIVGAGPYGLSLSAHLAAAGIDHRIYGDPMASWRDNMPAGMLLKSHSWSSSLYDPQGSFTVKTFCEELGIPYHDSRTPLSLDHFIAYGQAFQRRFVPQVEQKRLIACEATSAGLRATFDDGEVLATRHLVVAVGVHPFKYVPGVLHDLPPDALSHSGDYGPLNALAGKEVVVLGSGASAIDLAALLHEQGVTVSIVARTSSLRFAARPDARSSLARQMANPLRRLIFPRSGIGAGWRLKMYADAPWLIHSLPARYRAELARSTLGPLGGPFMKERVIGKLPVLLDRRVEAAETGGSRVSLRLAQTDGSREVLQADHVVAATGYRIDLRRLDFLDEPLRSQIRSIDNAAMLSADYECSVPGLHFIGPVSANSFGPVARFVFGAIHPSRRLTRRFLQSLPRRSMVVARAAELAPVS